MFCSFLNNFLALQVPGVMCGGKHRRAEVIGFTRLIDRSEAGSIAFYELNRFGFMLLVGESPDKTNGLPRRPILAVCF
jgi:hypothetical protein